MVATIEDIVGSEGISPAVLDVMRAVERYPFVPPEAQSVAQSVAHDDHP